MITLYDCATAPSPRRARILLAEKGVAHDTVQVDLRNGEQLGEAYRRINPQCTVPALRTEDGLLLTDNAAITAYVEARYPQPALLGETPAEKAEIASWNWRMEFEGLQAIAEALRNSAPAMANRALPGAVDYPQIPALAERGLVRVGQFFQPAQRTSWRTATLLPPTASAWPTSQRWWRWTLRAWSSTSRASNTRTCCAGALPWRSGRQCRSSYRAAPVPVFESQWVDARIAHRACSLHC